MHVERAGFLPVLSVGVIGSCAADVCEPRQVREEATVNGPLWVTWGRLITLTGRTGRKSVFYVSGRNRISDHRLRYIVHHHTRMDAMHCVHGNP